MDMPEERCILLLRRCVWVDGRVGPKQQHERSSTRTLFICPSILGGCLAVTEPKCQPALLLLLLYPLIYPLILFVNPSHHATGVSRCFNRVSYRHFYENENMCHYTMAYHPPSPYDQIGPPASFYDTKLSALLSCTVEGCCCVLFYCYVIMCSSKLACDTRLHYIAEHFTGWLLAVVVVVVGCGRRVSEGECC